MKPQHKLFVPLTLVSIILSPLIALSKNHPSLTWLLVGAQIALLIIVSVVHLKPEKDTSPTDQN